MIIDNQIREKIDLSQFTPATLEELDSKKLLDRFDTKFAFQAELLPDILDLLRDNYYILEIDGKRAFAYETLYFDTADYALHNAHHNGKLNRYKFRYRLYKETGTCFFEVKRKTNKKKTLKSRMKRKAIEEVLDKKIDKFVKEKTGLSAKDLLPTLWINYSRITFMHKHSDEKLTIDTDLLFKSKYSEKPFDELVIAELKRPDKYAQSEFIDYMNQFGIKRMRISKYCTGNVLTNPDVKYNRFKPKMMFINKLCNRTNGLQ